MSVRDSVRPVKDTPIGILAPIVDFQGMLIAEPKGLKNHRQLIAQNPNLLPIATLGGRSRQERSWCMAYRAGTLPTLVKLTVEVRSPGSGQDGQIGSRKAYSSTHTVHASKEAE